MLHIVTYVSGILNKIVIYVTMVDNSGFYSFDTQETLTLTLNLNVN